MNVTDTEKNAAFEVSEGKHFLKQTFGTENMIHYKPGL